jgi:hypothetical protein
MCAHQLTRGQSMPQRLRPARPGPLFAFDHCHASGQADALMTDLSSRQIPKKAGEVIDQLADSSRQIHQLISDVAQPDQQGMGAGANIRDSLMQASVATANLADATEALKHNFLTRGFFRKRGYYSLADISADEYRQDSRTGRPYAAPCVAVGIRAVSARGRWRGGALGSGCRAVEHDVDRARRCPRGKSSCGRGLLERRGSRGSLSLLAASCLGGTAVPSSVLPARTEESRRRAHEKRPAERLGTCDMGWDLSGPAEAELNRARPAVFRFPLPGA